MKYRCLVCGFAEMPYSPVPFNVCPCCGTEFGVDDQKANHKTLRLEWVKNGAPWFSDLRMPRKKWNSYQQLFEAGFGSEFITLSPVLEPEARVTVDLVRDVAWSLADLKGLLDVIKPIAA